MFIEKGVVDKVHDNLTIEVHTSDMTMTLTQLEKYMILEVENLHIKIDAFADIFQLMQDTMERILRRLDSIDTVLENHETRTTNLEA